MKKIFLLFFAFMWVHVNAQDVKSTFNNAYKKLAAEDKFKHASIGLLVVNNTTGQTITNVNAEVGLAPASCQKVVTATTSYELLGHSYSYKTTLGFTGKIIDGVLNGDIIIKGNGDPTLGSWRYGQTTEENVLSEFKKAVSRQGITEIKGHVYADESLWQGEVIPGGWIWEDVGNYYGAGARALNWRENQFDLILKSGSNIGDTVAYVGTKPDFVEGLDLKMLATSARKGSGDNSYIYIPLFNKFGYVRGTIPV
ncbi:MAG: D-alanyl-D-alanine carboxypeptidase, partial [Bacteroidota bacterium]|nr:D-alanyl-D-alanine carboxypeptidase [Bacteroidota bacterium]